MDVTPCPRERACEVIDLLSGGAVSQKRRDELIRAFTSIYFDNPWADPELSPLICEADKKIVGFLGITPRVMRFGDRRLRVAVSSNFTVSEAAPEKHRPFIAARMIKTMIGGPQDLCFADGATEVSRRIWERCGGSIAPPMGIDWFHTPRPARGLFELAKSGGAITPSMAWAARFGTSIADLIGAPLAARLSASGTSTHRLEPQELATAINERLDAPLKPEMNASWLRWLFDNTKRLASDGEVRMKALRSSDGTLAGWFVSILGQDRIVDVLQLEALTAPPEEVLGVAIADARTRGAALVRGHVRMAHLGAYRRHFCLMNSGRYVLIHAREQELLRPLLDGTAWISVLDGERWIGNFAR